MTGEEMRKRLEAFAEENEITLLLMDGLDDALLGIGYQFNTPLIIYSREKIIDILMERDGMTDEGAESFYDFNIVGGSYGEFTPVFLTVMPEDLG